MFSHTDNNASNNNKNNIDCKTSVMAWQSNAVLLHSLLAFNYTHWILHRLSIFLFLTFQFSKEYTY